MSCYVTMKDKTMSKYLQQAAKELHRYIGPRLTWIDTNISLTDNEKQALVCYLILDRCNELCNMGVHPKEAQKEAESDILELIDTLERGLQ
jgi:hypothetical protein